MSGTIDWIEFPAPDPAATAEFYSTVFGWTVTPYHEPPFLFTDGSGRVRGGFTTVLEPMPDYGIMISISVDDIAKTLRDVLANDGQVVLDRVDLPGGLGSFASVRDPGGNRISLFEGDVAAIGSDAESP